MTPRRPSVVAALGVVQILAWGSTYYLLAVLAEPIVADTGWSLGLVAGGMSLGLLASGLVALRVGRLIEAQGGRPVLAGAMALIALGLALLAAAPSPAAYLLAWAVIGVGMGGGLYDAAFATLGRLHGAGARRAITALTLWGGFASTVCWPLSAALVEAVGWRGACLAYAALHLLVTLPLCLLVLPREPRAAPAGGPAAAPLGAAAAVPLSDPRFWCLAVAGTSLATIAAVWSVHLIPILQAQGLTLAAAVALGALVGPAQVGARVIEMASGGRHHPVWTMAAATLLIALGLGGLATGLPAAAALVAYGAGNGVWSIARGALPLSLFGAGGYATTMGALATPMLLASAAAPTLGALLLQRLGAGATLAVLAAASAVPVLCVATLLALQGKARSQPG